MDVASLVYWPSFLPIILLPSSFSSKYNNRRYHGHHALAPMFCVIRAGEYAKFHPLASTTPVSAQNMLALHAHKYGGLVPSHFTQSVPTQNIPVGIIITHPVGIYLPTRSGLLGPIFRTTDRDYPC